jgi:hypothetical protein
MITSKVRRSLVLALILVTHTAAIAQQTAGPGQLALEIHYFPNVPPVNQIVATSAKAGGWFARFPRVDGWVQPPNSLPVMAVDIRSLMVEDGGARVWVSVLLGKLHEEQKEVGTYLLHEGDVITVKELASVGVVPFQIKVVRLAPLVGPVPPFNSRAKSIELVSIQSNLSAMPTIQLVVRNVSAKSVHALELETLQDGSPQIVTMPQGKEGEPLIVPGGTLELTAKLATRSALGANGYIPELVPNQTIAITAAVFGDGSYEGNAERASAFIGYQKGRKTQLQRVADIFAQAQNEATDAARIKDKVAALGLEADPAALADLSHQFPPQNRTERDRLKLAIEVAMRGIRDDVLKDISQFELRSRRQEPGIFNSWVASSKARYQAWLSRL